MLYKSTYLLNLCTRCETETSRLMPVTPECKMLKSSKDGVIGWQTGVRIGKEYSTPPHCEFWKLHLSRIFNIIVNKGGGMLAPDGGNALRRAAIKVLLKVILKHFILLQPFNFVNLLCTICHQRLPTPPILPTDRHCARYKFLYCIVLYCNRGLLTPAPVLTIPSRQFAPQIAPRLCL